VTDAAACLNIWTVYDHPKDFPDVYVARRWEVSRAGIVATSSIIFSLDLNQLRPVLDSMGLTCMPRAENDDPSIVECWL
jgi:hypothetical protein